MGGLFLYTHKNDFLVNKMRVTYSAIFCDGCNFIYSFNIPENLIFREKNYNKFWCFCCNFSPITGELCLGNIYDGFFRQTLGSVMMRGSPTFSRAAASR